MASQEKKSVNFGRLSKLREILGDSQRAFAAKCGFDPKTVANWERGETLPNLEHLQVIAETTGANAFWLVTGEGPILSEKSTERGKCAKPKRLPIVGESQAGPGGRYPYDWAEFFIPQPLYLRRDDAFGIIVRGDSMQPVYRDGDVVVCAIPTDGSDRAKSGEHAVVVLEDYESVLKIFVDLVDTVRLESLNKDYDPIVISKTKVRHVMRVLDHIWAKHVQALRIENDEGAVDEC